MRKLFIVTLVSLLVLPAAGTHAAPKGPSVDFHRYAITSFLDRSGSGAPTFYIAAGMSFEIAQDVAFAGRGPCRRVERRGRKVWSCRASARGVPVTPVGFNMDPLLQTAHVSFEHGRYEHTVDWTGKDEPDFSYFGNTSNAIVYAYNSATVTGRLFGRRFSTKRDRAHGFLGEGAYASVALDGLEFHVGDDGRLQVQALFPAGR